MTKFTIAIFCLGFWIGILPGILNKKVTLWDKNQKIQFKACKIVCGYWSKDGVLELVKEN